MLLQAIVSSKVRSKLRYVKRFKDLQLVANLIHVTKDQCHYLYQVPCISAGTDNCRSSCFCKAVRRGSREKWRQFSITAAAKARPCDVLDFNRFRF